MFDQGYKVFQIGVSGPNGSILYANLPGCSLIFRENIHISIGFNGKLTHVRDSEFGYFILLLCRSRDPYPEGSWSLICYFFFSLIHTQTQTSPNSIPFLCFDLTHLGFDPSSPCSKMSSNLSGHQHKKNICHETTLLFPCALFTMTQYPYNTGVFTISFCTSPAKLLNMPVYRWCMCMQLLQESTMVWQSVKNWYIHAQRSQNTWESLLLPRTSGSAMHEKNAANLLLPAEYQIFTRTQQGLVRKTPNVGQLDTD